MISQEELDLCAKIRETGTVKMKERIDRLSEVVGIKWNVEGEKNWVDRVDSVTRELRGCVYSWMHDTYDLLRAGRTAFMRHGVSFTKFDPRYGGDFYATMVLWNGYDKREVEITGRCTPYGGRVSLPSMAWHWKDGMTSAETMDSLTKDLRYVDDLTDFCIRYKAAKSEVNDIEVQEGLERVAKSRHQLELLEKL